MAARPRFSVFAHDIDPRPDDRSACALPNAHGDPVSTVFWKRRAFEGATPYDVVLCDAPLFPVAVHAVDRPKGNGHLQPAVLKN